MYVVVIKKDSKSTISQAYIMSLNHVHIQSCMSEGDQKTLRAVRKRRRFSHCFQNVCICPCRSVVWCLITVIYKWISVIVLLIFFNLLITDQRLLDEITCLCQTSAVLKLNVQLKVKKPLQKPCTNNLAQRRIQKDRDQSEYIKLKTLQSRRLLQGLTTVEISQLNSISRCLISPCKSLLDCNVFSVKIVYQGFWQTFHD